MLHNRVDNDVHGFMTPPHYHNTLRKRVWFVRRGSAASTPAASSDALTSLSTLLAAVTTIPCRVDVNDDTVSTVVATMKSNSGDSAVAAVGVHLLAVISAMSDAHKGLVSRTVWQGRASHFVAVAADGKEEAG